MYNVIAHLYPTFRNITGEGLPQTLRVIGGRIPLLIREVPTGTRVFDRTIPREWRFRDAYTKTATAKQSWTFMNQIYTLSITACRCGNETHWRSCRTICSACPRIRTGSLIGRHISKRIGGFCLHDETRRTLPAREYEAVIDTSLEDGSLSYGEVYIPGDRTDELLISAHACHPSLYNDNPS